MNIINDSLDNDDYKFLYKEIICQIEQNKTNIATYKKIASYILEPWRNTD